MISDNRFIMVWGFILILASAAVLGGSWLYASGHQLKLSNRQPGFSPGQPKCESLETVATLKSMALRKFNDMAGYYLVPHRRITLSDGGKTASYIRGKFSPENLTIGSFGERGEVGTAGLSCAALIVTHAAGEKSGGDEISVEYTIEPTTDGKTMVSARFRPNS